MSLVLVMILIVSNWKTLLERYERIVCLVRIPRITHSAK